MCLVYQNSLISYLRINIQPWGATNSSRRLLIIKYFYSFTHRNHQHGSIRILRMYSFFYVYAESRVNDTRKLVNRLARRSGNIVIYTDMDRYRCTYIKFIYTFWIVYTFCVFYRIFIHLSYFCTYDEIAEKVQRIHCRQNKSTTSSSVLYKQNIFMFSQYNLPTLHGHVFQIKIEEKEHHRIIFIIFFLFLSTVCFVSQIFFFIIFVL